MDGMGDGRWPSHTVGHSALREDCGDGEMYSPLIVGPGHSLRQAQGTGMDWITAYSYLKMGYLRRKELH